MTSRVFSVPCEVQGHKVPHLKALVNGNMESRGLSKLWLYFYLMPHSLKKNILLHIEGLVDSQMSTAVILEFGQLEGIFFCGVTLTMMRSLELIM